MYLKGTLTEDWLRVFVEVVVEFQFSIQLFRDQHVLNPTIQTHEIDISATLNIKLTLLSSFPEQATMQVSSVVWLLRLSCSGQLCLCLTRTPVCIK